jgi:hypothetical protein
MMKIEHSTITDVTPLARSLVPSWDLIRQLQTVRFHLGVLHEISVQARRRPVCSKAFTRTLGVECGMLATTPLLAHAVNFSNGFRELTDTRLGKEESAAADHMLLERRLVEVRTLLVVVCVLTVNYV